VCDHHGVLDLLRRLLKRGPPTRITLPAPPPDEAQPALLLAAAAGQLGSDTLAHVLARGPVPEAELAWCITRLCGLFHAGTRPLRSLTAQGITFTRTGEPVILAKNLDGHRDPLRALSPELVRGLPTDARTDVFSLARVLFDAVSGQALFAGESDFEQLRQVRDAVLPPRPAAMSTGMYEVLQRALSAEPGQRLRDPAALGQALAPLTTASAGREFARRIARHQAAAGSAPPVAARKDEESRIVGLLHDGGEPARLVYADWLEEHGRGVEAQWVRVETRMQTLPPVEQRACLAQLRALQVSADFLVKVSRPAIEGCPVRLGLRCPLTWSALTPTAREDVRACDACGRQVHSCTTVEQAAQLSEADQCVALDPSLLRTEDDLQVVRTGVVGQAVSFAWTR
jgi:hypothetical protein